MRETIIPFSAKTIGASTYKGRKAQTLLLAARHNLRDIQKELGANSHIDAARIGLNQILAGPDTPVGVVDLAQAFMEGCGVRVSKLRKDHTQAHELLFTLAADTTVNPRDYFRHCLAWTVDQFGCDNIVSAVVHLDESAPHLHILIVPMAEGRYVGTSLIDRARLANLRALFATDVAPAFGLKVMPPLTGATRAKAILMIYERLESTLDPVLHSALWLTVKADIARNPAPYMVRMGIVSEPPAPINDGGKEFRRIALSTGKGGKTERWAKPYGFESGVSDGVPKPYGFENDPKNHRNPSCVGFHSKAPSSTAPTPPPPAHQQAPVIGGDVALDQPAHGTPAAKGADVDGEVAPLPHRSLATFQVRMTAAARNQPNEGSVDDGGYVETTTRERDSDLDPAHFHNGEHCAPPPPAPRRHKQACDAALVALNDYRVRQDISFSVGPSP